LTTFGKEACFGLGLLVADGQPHALSVDGRSARRRGRPSATARCSTTTRRIASRMRARSRRPRASRGRS
jgi:hypothetical protein